MQAYWWSTAYLVRRRPSTKKYIINKTEKPIVETVYSLFFNRYGYNQILMN